MRGSAVKVLVGPKLLYGCQNQDWRTFCLSKTWLAYHSRYFSNAARGYLIQFDEILIDADPDIFALFVEFMIRGQYTWRDTLKQHEGIRESAKVWILAEFLEAPKFQNLAMRNLYNIYKGKPRSGVGPAAIEYVCENCTEDSPLYCFFQDVATTYWTNKSVVYHAEDSVGEWKGLWQRFPKFRDTLLERLAGSSYQIKHVNEYLVGEYEWQNDEESSE